jgi:two-component system response regulator YesN
MLKVLIVEDEEIIRKGLVYTIDWLSMDCVVVGDAENGMEGLDKISQTNPDIVITDIKMPILSGIEMLQKAKENGSSNFIGIILTSYSEFEYAQKAISLGVFDYLLKPIDEDRLKVLIIRAKGALAKSNEYKDLIKCSHNQETFKLIDWGIYSGNEAYKNPYVNRVINEIRNHYMQKMSIESISKFLGISPSYISRKLKDATNQNFLDLLNKYRVQKAVELLSKGQYRVYEISDLTGFSDYKHFCAVFKKYTGATPTEFIKGSKHLVYHQGGEEN